MRVNMVKRTHTRGQQADIHAARACSHHIDEFMDMHACISGHACHRTQDKTPNTPANLPRGEPVQLARLLCKLSLLVLFARVVPCLLFNSGDNLALVLLGGIVPDDVHL